MFSDLYFVQLKSIEPSKIKRFHPINIALPSRSYPTHEAQLITLGRKILNSDGHFFCPKFKTSLFNSLTTFQKLSMALNVHQLIHASVFNIWKLFSFFNQFLTILFHYQALKTDPICLKTKLF